MKSKKMDRRSERTRRLVGEALVSLLLEKRYDTITIQDILERADIGRSTFYEHYWDKEDLLTSEIERMVERLVQQLGTARQSTPTAIPSLALFRHVQEHHRLYQALLRGRGIEIVIQALLDQLRTRVQERFLQVERKESEAEDVLDAAASYVAGAFVTLLQWWLKTEMSLSPERMDTLFHDLVLPGVNHLLAQKTKAGEE